MSGSEPRQGTPLPRVALYLLAWGLSSIPILAGFWFPAGDLEAALGDGSRAALAWLPWLALIGLPGRNTVGLPCEDTVGLPNANSKSRDWPLALGMALPLLAVATWIDWRAGLGSGRVAATVVAGLVTLVTLGEARQQATRAGLAMYGLLWFALVAVIPALAVAIAWGAGGRLADSGLASELAGFSPISAMWRDVRPLEGVLYREGWNSALFCPSTLACVSLLMIVAVLGRRGRGA